MVGIYFDSGDKKNDDFVERVFCRFDCMVLCYFVISFVEFVYEGSKKVLFGENFDLVLVWIFLLYNMVLSKILLIFLWYISDDSSVFVENFFLFVMVLKKYGVLFEFYIFFYGKYGFGFVSYILYVKEWIKFCEKWFESIGFIGYNV